MRTCLLCVSNTADLPWFDINVWFRTKERVCGDGLWGCGDAVETDNRLMLEFPEVRLWVQEFSFNFVGVMVSTFLVCVSVQWLVIKMTKSDGKMVNVLWGNDGNEQQKCQNVRLMVADCCVIYCACRRAWNLHMADKIYLFQHDATYDRCRNL